MLSGIGYREDTDKIWIMQIEHSTLSDDRTQCDLHKIFPGAHETNNDALKAEGGTQKSVC